jgi:hypothetical protein
MFKRIKFKILAASLMVLIVSLSSFLIELAYRDVVDGNLKILIPKDFMHVDKQSYKLSYQGDKAPDDFYCNKDTSESIGFLKTKPSANNFDWCKQMVQELILNTETKIYFNDTTSINGNKVYVVAFDGMDKGKLKYMKMFFLNIGGHGILGIISCNLGLPF